MRRIGQSADFVRALEALRTKYKIKRNFIKEVERRRKSLYLVSRQRENVLNGQSRNDLLTWVSLGKWQEVENC
jgi:hypothetical protein